MFAHSTATQARPSSCPCPLPCECAFPTLLRTRIRSALRAEPLLRNGHVLTLSSVTAAALGAVFWVLSTRWYSADVVGRSYTALAAVSLLSGIGQLNLGDVLVRFVPVAGRRTGRVVLRCYLVSAAFSAVAAAAFLLAQPLLAPGLAFLREPVVALAFIAATAGYTLFVLQDGALTGLRRPNWVLGENALFAVAKAVLLAAFVALGSGILVSWTVALVLSLAVTNGYLFRRAIPDHQRAAAPTGRPAAGLARYTAADYVGSLFRMVAYSVMPLLVLNRYGAAQSAYFSLAWVIAYTFFLAAMNMGSSLIVEAAHAPELLAVHARKVLRHAGLMLTAGVAVTLVAAPWLLSLFGPGYAHYGTAPLRLLVLAALPNLVVGIAIDVARARRQLGRMMGLQIVLYTLVVAVILWLLPSMGLTGIGLGWLLAESVLAVPLLLTMPRWLPVPGRRPVRRLFGARHAA
ncbi:lipopolysaccharide biosynthesis protein [Kitasatospora sp. NPDC059571]|uniref:lipopolysaccharide biosynthesis protein n=1 Tax=Kitasatospora sp. NPDC059571 TaxID=3346871 RepID=UPI00369F3A24